MSSVIGLPVATMLLASLIVALGIAVQASIGFGLALIAAPLLYLLDPQLVPAPLIMTAWTLSLWIVCREWQVIEFTHFRAAFAGRMIGAPLAAIVAVTVSQVVFDFVFGFLVLLAVALSLLHKTIEPDRRSVFFAMTASGFMGTISGIDGPPLALLYQNMDSARLRANLAFMFLLGTTISLVMLSTVGRFGMTEFRSGVILHAGVVLGILSSGVLKRKLAKTKVRPLLLGLCALSSLLVLGRAITSLL